MNIAERIRIVNELAGIYEAGKADRDKEFNLYISKRKEVGKMMEDGFYIEIMEEANPISILIVEQRRDGPIASACADEAIALNCDQAKRLRDRLIELYGLPGNKSEDR